MDKVTLQIALAALMHDIGKLAQDGMEVSQQYSDGNCELYQPFDKEHNYHTHRHALYTAAFIEEMADSLPKELNSADWVEEGSFINLAAMHHKPETILQQIITQADCLSAGLDRTKGKEDIDPRAYRKTRLVPLFEQLSLEDTTAKVSMEEFDWEYPLEPLSSETIFPRKRISLNKNQAKEEYKKLYDEFAAALGKLKNRDDVALWMEHFTSLLQSFTAMIPQARAGKEILPDTSLYDHARTTSALAAALYLYHRDQKSLTEEGAIDDNSQEKFLLIGGDFYGIQEFIFNSGGDSSANRSKLLRGRSFYVSLISELAADMFCRTLGLPATAVVLNAAGKFTLLAANTSDAKEKINEVRRQLNEWLYKHTFATSSFGITVTPARQEEFTADKFAALWKRHKQDMEKTKTCRLDFAAFGGAVPMEDYLERFNNKLENQLCPFCGVRPAEFNQKDDYWLGEDGGSSCSLCRDQIMLGAQLIKGKWLAFIENNKEGGGMPKGEKKELLRAPIFNRYQLMFCNETEADKLNSSSLIKLWSMGSDKGSAVSKVTNRFLNGYVPVCLPSDTEDDRLMAFTRREEDLKHIKDGAKDGRPKTFADIACLAQEVDENRNISGTAALGILKADVDQLGLLMACGLPEERYTISRMAALSRQLDSFFSLYLPELLKNDERFSSVYTVFAGGDDLFLIGPWNRMQELLLYLRKEFSRFVCENNDIHFSAGIAMVKPHTPVDRLAEVAEEALEQAKESGRNRVTIFHETVEWNKLEELTQIEEDMEEWRKSYLGGALFYRLNELVDMAGQEKRLNKDTVSYQEMECLRWRAQLQYQLARNINPELKGEKREQAVKELQSLGIWITKHGGAMRIPLWNVLYNHR